MGRKVKVVTKCGETFTYDHDQEVATVEIVEDPKRKLTSVLREFEEFMKGSRCSGVVCTKCAFETPSGGCAHNDAFAALRGAVGFSEL